MKMRTETTITQEERWCDQRRERCGDDDGNDNNKDVKCDVITAMMNKRRRKLVCKLIAAIKRWAIRKGSKGSEGGNVRNGIWKSSSWPWEVCMVNKAGTYER